MIVYKFRVTFEDPEDVSRDIEIKPANTFAAFHKAILEAINFDSSGEANFYVSDDYWRKGEKIPFESLEKKKLVEFVEDPHQKFLYEYESKSKWPFTIELFKIMDGLPTDTYPRCVKSTGIAPVQFNLVNPILSDDEISKESGIPDEIDDNIFYSNHEELEGFSETDDSESKGSDYDEEENDEEAEDENAFEGDSRFEEEDY